MIEQDFFKVDHLQTLILDEADVLLDFGFDKDIMAIQELIKAKNDRDLQVLCFSATLNDTLYNILSSLSSRKFKKIDLINEEDNQSPSAITHYFTKSRGLDEKFNQIRDIIQSELGDHGQCIIFTN